MQTSDKAQLTGSRQTSAVQSSTLGLGLEAAAHAGVAGLDVEGFNLPTTHEPKGRRGSVCRAELGRGEAIDRSKRQVAKRCGLS